MGSVVKKRRKRMAKKKHRKLLRKTRVQRRRLGTEVGEGAGGRAGIGPDQLDVLQLGSQGRGRFVRIQADYAFDTRIGGEASGHPGTERPADSGHDDNAGR